MKMFKTASKIIAIASMASLMTITAAMAQEVFVEGTVLPAKGGFELLTDSGPNYRLEGRDLSALVGKPVQITGNLEENAAGRTIKVEIAKDASY